MVTWRVGRTLGRTIYLQIGDEASKEDVFVGLMETRLLAREVVKTMNAYGAVVSFDSQTGFEEK